MPAKAGQRPDTVCCITTGPLNGDPEVWEYLKLYLHDSEHLLLSLPGDQMPRLVDWLIENNPSVRLGPYGELAAELMATESRRVAGR